MEVKKAELSNLDDIVKVHLHSFPGFFLTSLGYKFLFQYYKIYIQNGHIAFVLEDKGLIEGFVVGTNSSERFYKDLKSNILFFLVPVLSNLFNPKLLTKIFNRACSIFFKKRVNNELEKYVDQNELTSIGVMPTDQNKGIGTLLLSTYEDYCLTNNVNSIYLTTDADNNEPALNFYKKNGFKVDLRFYQGKGRKMFSLTKKL